MKYLEVIREMPEILRDLFCVDGVNDPDRSGPVLFDGRLARTVFEHFRLHGIVRIDRWDTVYPVFPLGLDRFDAMRRDMVQIIGGKEVWGVDPQGYNTSAIPTWFAVLALHNWIVKETVQEDLSIRETFRGIYAKAA